MIKNDKLKETRICFAQVRPVAPHLEVGAIAARLQKFSDKLSGNRNVAISWRSRVESGLDLVDQYISSEDGRRTIKRRAEGLARRAEQQSGMAHLNSEERKRLFPTCERIALIALPSLHRADEIAAALHAEFPWMSAATEVIWKALRRSAATGEPGFRIPPLILEGDPGIGKSAWARRLAELLGVPFEFIDAVSEPAGFAISGLQKGWSSANPGRPLDLILNGQIANPLIVIDEAEKAGSAETSKGLSVSLAAALLPLLEPSTAKRWSCPFYRIPFDMSRINWILTVNDGDRLPTPLLSRCTRVRLPDLTLGQLQDFASREGARRGLGVEAIGAMVEVLDRTRGSRAQARLDLRHVLRLIECAEAHEHGFDRH